MTDLTIVPDVAAATRPARGSGAGASAARWSRVALACAVLAASGGVRWWQARRVGDVLRQGRNLPFPLKEIPMALGPWRGETAVLDPTIVRATGAADLITRRYVDGQTGAAVDLIVMYGPPAEMYIHTPDVCYPAAGYQPAEAPEDRTVRAGRVEAPFRTLVFSKGEGGQAGREEVYFSWRAGGRWSLHIGLQKHYERIPGIVKVLLSRHVTGVERRDVGNPCEALLEALIPDLERRLAVAAPSDPGGSLR